MKYYGLGVPPEPGNAPVALPVIAGTHGLMTPVWSTGPVPIEALLAPEVVMPPSEVAAIEVEPAGLESEDWPVIAAVLPQAGLAFGWLWAKAEADSAIPIATEAEKMKRDIINLQSFFCLV